MNDIKIQGIEDNLILHRICNEVSAEYCNTPVVGADLLFCIVHNIDYDLLSNITYIFISKRNFDRLKRIVIDRYKRAVKH